MSPLLFVNIGWMVHYSGPSPKDPTLGGHGHLKTTKIGHEAWNFAPFRGKLLGYVPRSAAIDLTNLGASKHSGSVQGVTVVWIARNPRDKKTYIVGWYKNAVVYRHADSSRVRHVSDMSVEYQIEAEVGDLLTVDARVFRIPTAKVEGNLGQHPIWYGRPEEEFRDSVRTYIATGRLPQSDQAAAPRQSDPALRMKIEKAAVDHAKRYFKSAEGGRRSVVSVERDGCGWDLEATLPDGSCLKVEVKGLSGPTVNCELTPNEFSKMMAPEHRPDYIVYVVTNALEDSAKAHIFRYNSDKSYKKNHVWLTDDGRKLKVEERMGARLSSPDPA